MGVSYEEAKRLEKKAREDVAQKTIVRNEAKRTLEEARRALTSAEQARVDAKKGIEELQVRLRSTREAIMPCEAASKRAHLELTASQGDLEKIRDERIAAEEELSQLEVARDQAEALLDGAQVDARKLGENETSSRVTLDARVQRATDAQRALDAAMQAIDEATQEADAARRRVEKAKLADASLPKDDDPLMQAIRSREEELEKAIAHSKEAASHLQNTRRRLTAAEKASAKAKEAYEKAQANLRTAIASADKAEAKLRDVQQQPELDQQDKEQQARARADYAAASDVRSAAMTVNARALTALADADVEAIRLRIACDEAANAVDESNANRARAERELREAQEAIEQSKRERQESARAIAKLEDELHEIEANLERLELIGREALEENAAAQKGLKEMQERAVVDGQKSRDAADVLDGRRHELSDIVASVELGRARLMSLRNRERDCAARVETAFAICEEADVALGEAQSFIVDAQGQIDAKRAAMSNAERRAAELSVAYRNADEELSRAQRDLDVAQADLTDAQVSIIMAEIDERR